MVSPKQTQAEQSAAQQEHGEHQMIKRKHLISTAIGVVALAALSGGALAATNDHRGDGATDLRTRVSEILGIDADELGDAFSQARTELKDEAVAERLAALVADGTITQEQADEVVAWQDSKPAILDELGHAGRGHRGGPMDQESRLDALVTDGTITQEQADAIAAWYDARPDVVEELKPDRENGRRGHHRRGPGRGSFGRFGGGFSPGEGSRFQIEIPGFEGGQIFEVPVPPEPNA